jgi:glycosyltransferase involved in cell wall biosynthesis
VDGVTGFASPPTPDGLASAIDRLASDPTSAAAMGRAGRDAYAERQISWNSVVAQLTA